MIQAAHQPVLLGPAMTALAVRPAGCYVDATYGRGGHSGAILNVLSNEGRLVAFDQDPDAADDAHARYGSDTRFTFCRDSFAHMSERLEQLSLLGRVDGILFDLGVSSPQFDTPERGFSFRYPGPLDMRMDPTIGLSLADWLADATVDSVRDVLRRYGEESFATRMARAVIAARDEGTLTDTAALAAVIKSAMPVRVAAGMKIHPATRAFQAFRIYINGELNALTTAMDAALDVLAPGGRLVVISFHSLEDRIVKRFIRDQARPEPPPVPMAPMPAPALLSLGKAIRPTAEDIAFNPRARSAILRVAERTGAAKVMA